MQPTEGESAPPWERRNHIFYWAEEGAEFNLEGI